MISHLRDGGIQVEMVGDTTSNTVTLNKDEFLPNVHLKTSFYSTFKITDFYFLHK